MVGGDELEERIWRLPLCVRDKGLGTNLLSGRTQRCIRIKDWKERAHSIVLEKVGSLPFKVKKIQSVESGIIANLLVSVLLSRFTRFCVDSYIYKICIINMHEKWWKWNDERWKWCMSTNSFKCFLKRSVWMALQLSSYFLSKWLITYVCMFHINAAIIVSVLFIVM